MPVKTGVVIFVTLSLLDEPLSLAAARSGTETAGPLVSMVTTSAVDVAWFPAKSVARAAILWVPLASTLEVIDQLPLASAVALPSTVLPSSSCTRAPASAVPLKTGVVMLVMLSVLELPLSLESVKSGAETAGVVVSIVTTTAAKADWFPAKSVACAAITWTPSLKAVDTSDQLPALSATALPITELPSKSCTEAPGSAVPTTTGLVTLVMPSEFEAPVSLADDSRGFDIVGAIVSTVTASAAEVA